MGDEGLERCSHEPIKDQVLAQPPEQAGANTVANLPLSQLTGRLIERWDSLTKEERLMLNLFTDWVGQIDDYVYK